VLCTIELQQAVLVRTYFQRNAFVLDLLPALGSSWRHKGERFNRY
jgi:hypothetical protein